MKEREMPEELGDISAEAFRKHLHEMADWIADYREKIADLPISTNLKPGELVAQLSATPPERGEPLEQILADVDRFIVPNVTHWAHPQFMGYFGCTTTAPGILAEMIAAALNVNAMSWGTAPAATELEMVVLEWLRQWLGLPNEFKGVVYDTASIGSMHALAIAREQAAQSVRTLGLTGRDLPLLRIYVSDQTHSSIDKGVIALGLGEQNIQRVPSDAKFRMDVSALREMIDHDVHQKFKPIAVVATVGTTSTASVDCVAEVAKICREHNIWLHIDAAYGGGLALLPEHKWVTEGWSEADSLVINPHKMLFVPFDFSVLYVHDLERLRRVFTLVPDYLRGDAPEAGTNYMDYGVQLGRRFRSIKAWMVWRTFGRAGLAARIREHLRLAQLFTEWIKADPHFELSAPTVMGVVCFRVRCGDEATSDRTNSHIVETINARGETYLMQTKLRGRVVMRLGLGNILTTEQHLRNVWQLIQEAASRAIEPNRRRED